MKSKSNKNKVKLRWKNKAEPPTHATSKLGKGVEFKNGFVLAEKSNNRKKLIINPQPACSAGTLAVSLPNRTKTKHNISNMKITWDDLKVDFTHIDLKRLIESWDWLIGNDKTPILVSSIGDIFLEDRNEKCYWLNVGEGIIEKVAEDKTEFKEKLKDNEIVSEWFLVELVAELKKRGMELTEKKLYGYIKLPVLGGEYEPENFELTDIEVHFELSGQIHKQIKDLPDGTNVKIVTE